MTTCPTYSLEVRLPHTDPWACIAALKARVAFYQRDGREIMEQVRRMVEEPTDDGKLRIMDPGERGYWQDVLRQMQEKLVTNAEVVSQQPPA